MDAPRVLHLYLTDYVLWHYTRRSHPFLNRVADVLIARGWQVTAGSDGLADRLRAAVQPGYHLFYEHPPAGPRCLTARRVYWDPFWRIEASHERWHWPVAHAPFDPAQVDPKRADGFARFWRPRLGLDAREGVDRGAFIYVPLQGQWGQRRSFQSMSPAKMVDTLLERCDAPLVLTCHPGETLGEADRARLAAWTRDPRVTLSTAPMADLLTHARFVATQNSSVALKGFFVNTPALLFAQVDFHHVAASVPRDGLSAALAQAGQVRTDYAQYLFWFFQKRALNHWRDDFPDRLTAWLAGRGWTM